MADMRHELANLTEEQHSQLAHAVMKQQSNLSLRVAIIFLFVLLGLPLFNHYKSSIANQQIGGLTVTWLILGILLYPLTWLLSAYYVQESEKIEAKCSDWRSILGHEAGEDLEPQGVGDVKPAFIESDLPSSDNDSDKGGSDV